MAEPVTTTLVVAALWALASGIGRAIFDGLKESKASLKVGKSTIEFRPEMTDKEFSKAVEEALKFGQAVEEVPKT